MSVKFLFNSILNLRSLVLSVAFLQAIFVAGQSLEPVGIFSHHQDVGSPMLKGSVVYDKENQTYTVSGAGKNMWATEDQFHFLWKKVKGDFIIRASVKFIGKGTDPHRKIGIIARDQLTANSKYADACVHGDVLTSLQYRSNDGDSTDQVVLSTYYPTDIELERVGNTFTFSAAVFGEPYKSVTKEIELNEEVYAGLFICSHLEDVMEKAIFSNVQIIIPAPKNFVPYRDYIALLILCKHRTGLRITNI
jgi:TolB protein